MVHGSAESGAVKDLGKPGARESHARFDERGLETEYGLGPQRLQRDAWTAPDLSTTAPAPDSTDGASEATRRIPIAHGLSGRLIPPESRQNRRQLLLRRRVTAGEEPMFYEAMRTVRFGDFFE